MSAVPAPAAAEQKPPPRPRDHLPPLLRGSGFLLVLIASVIVGVREHRENVEIRARMIQARARMDAVAASATPASGGEAIAQEIRLLRLQLQEQDFADRVLDDPLFQLLGSLGSALVAASFFLEAKAKWPARKASTPAAAP